MGRIVRRVVLRGNAYYKGEALRSQEDLVAHFGSSRVERKMMLIRRHKTYRTSVASPVDPSFPSVDQPGGADEGLFPRPAERQECGLNSVFFNVQSFARERLEEVLRFYANKDIIALASTGRPIKATPRGPRGGMDHSKALLRREYWMNGFYIIEWGWARHQKQMSSNKSCGVLLAIREKVLTEQGWRIAERRDPPRKWAGRYGAIRLKRKARSTFDSGDLITSVGYAPQDDAPLLTREGFWAAWAALHNSPFRTTPYGFIDANRHISDLLESVDGHDLSVGPLHPQAINDNGASLASALASRGWRHAIHSRRPAPSHAPWRKLNGQARRSGTPMANPGRTMLLPPAAVSLSAKQYK